jgi:alcohol dehydrogenase (NADP+)
MISTQGYAVRSAKDAPAPLDFERRDLGPNDVLIDIAYCGICHSDIHQARDDWGGSIYPMVPGHEIVGTVAQVGKAVTKFKAGDRAGVGTLVDSCRECEACKAGEEVYCSQYPAWTYNARDKAGNILFGGYSSKIVVDADYVLRIPHNLDLAAVAPLLCAGITTYSPLRHWKVGRGTKVGVVGLGGLGHLALKFAHSFGAEAVQFTTSESKIADARKLGANDVILTRGTGWWKGHTGTFDFILDCVSAPHDVTPYLALLKRDATMCCVGMPEKPMAVPAVVLALGRRRLAGSATGGIRETQEMIDYCGKAGIVSEIELTTYDKLEAAWERVVKGDVKYRFVLDSASLR